MREELASYRCRRWIGSSVCGEAMVSKVGSKAFEAAHDAHSGRAMSENMFVHHKGREGGDLSGQLLQHSARNRRVQVQL